MKINLSIEKKHILTLVIVICIISSIGYLVATPATPGVSHPADEVTPGPFAAGDYTFPGKLTLGNDPTDNMDAATKQYVDAQSGGGRPLLPTYIIRSTSATYKGNLGGRAGANDKCQSEFGTDAIMFGTQHFNCYLAGTCILEYRISAESWFDLTGDAPMTLESSAYDNWGSHTLSCVGWTSGDLGGPSGATFDEEGVFRAEGCTRFDIYSIACAVPKY